MRQHISPVSCGHRQAKALVARGNKRSQGLNAMQMSGGGRRAPPADRVHRRAAAGRTRQRQTTSPGQAARSGPRPGNRSHPERSGQRRYRSARWPWAAPTSRSPNCSGCSPPGRPGVLLQIAVSRAVMTLGDLSFALTRSPGPPKPPRMCAEHHSGGVTPPVSGNDWYTEKKSELRTLVGVPLPSTGGCGVACPPQCGRPLPRMAVSGSWERTGNHQRS